MSTINFSTASITANVTSEIGKLSAQLHEAESVALTGLAVSSPSDAPEVWPQVDKLLAGINDQGIYQDNADAATTLMATADDTLNAIGDVMNRALEISITMASETVSAEDRAAAAIEVAELQAELVALSNTSINGRYVFGGTDYGTPPYDATGTYSGTSVAATIQVADGQSVDAGWVGDDIFNSGVDIFGALDDLAVALIANDTTAISDAVTNFTDAGEQVSTARTEIGYDWATAIDAAALAANLEITMVEQYNNLVGADPVEAYTNLANLQFAYEAALQVASSAIGTSLFSYLR